MHRVVRRQKTRMIVGVLLIVAYLVVSRLVAGPDLVLPAPTERMMFKADFTLPDVQGRLVSLSSFRGRPVVLNLWATWCYPCREEMPSMQALYRDYHIRGLVMLAIAVDEGGPAVVIPFIQTHGFTFSVLLDPQNTLGTRLQIPAIPSTYVLDKQGRIVGLEMGARDWNTPQVRRFVEQLLAEDGGGPTP
ncbi:MAG: redoxin domain-containing protein [Candidatus Tectomicrobia bacterium]|uniref:Redoxin domain-containing protein n=1 Tax=Tectimicrobiota bacterium TaxID=2528274 RepID=A0A937W1W1_UNCTE|nr:redoxin domain-containing protein [Candidatus Tectomicrobia bacterium]